MDLGRFVLDKQLLDSQSRRCGKVDDLMLVWEDDVLPKVAAILCQKGALSRDLGPFALRVAEWLYGLLGIRHPSPVCIDWDLVEKIDVVVHLRKTRSELGLQDIQQGMSNRVMSKIPGA